MSLGYVSINSTSCSLCGNGRLDAGEQCDSLGFGCNNTCQCSGEYTGASPLGIDCVLKCGNGVIDDAEYCEVGGMGCSDTCQCRSNYTANVPPTKDCFWHLPESPGLEIIIPAVIVPIVVLGVGLAILIVLLKRRKQKKSKNKEELRNANDENLLKKEEKKRQREEKQRLAEEKKNQLEEQRRRKEAEQLRIEAKRLQEKADKAQAKQRAVEKSEPQHQIQPKSTSIYVEQPVEGAHYQTIHKDNRKKQSLSVTGIVGKWIIFA